MKLYTDELLKVAALEAKVKTLQATSGANMSWPAMCTRDTSACLTFAQTQLTARCTPPTGGTAYPAACASAVSWARAWATATGLCGAGSTPTLASCAASAAATSGDGVCGTWAKLAVGAAPTATAGLGLMVPVTCTADIACGTGGACYSAALALSNVATTCPATTGSGPSGNAVTFPAGCVTPAKITSEHCLGMHGGTSSGDLTTVGQWPGSATAPTQAQWSGIGHDQVTTVSFLVQVHSSATFTSAMNLVAQAAIATMFPGTLSNDIVVTSTVAKPMLGNAGSTNVFFHRRALQAANVCTTTPAKCRWLEIVIYLPSNANGATWTDAQYAMNQITTQVSDSANTALANTFKAALSAKFASTTTLVDWKANSFSSTWFTHTLASSPPPLPPLRPPPALPPVPPPSPPPPSPPPPSPPPLPPPPSTQPGAQPAVGNGALTVAGGLGAWECSNPHSDNKGMASGIDCGWNTFGVDATSVDVGCCANQAGLTTSNILHTLARTVGGGTPARAATLDAARSECADMCYRDTPSTADFALAYPTNTRCTGFTLMTGTGSGNVLDAASAATYYTIATNPYSCILYSTCQSTNTDDGKSPANGAGAQVLDQPLACTATTKTTPGTATITAPGATAEQKKPGGAVVQGGTLIGISVGVHTSLRRQLAANGDVKLDTLKGNIVNYKSSDAVAGRSSIVVTGKTSDTPVASSSSTATHTTLTYSGPALTGVAAPTAGDTATVIGANGVALATSKVTAHDSVGKTITVSPAHTADDQAVVATALASGSTTVAVSDSDGVSRIGKLTADTSTGSTSVSIKSSNGKPPPINAGDHVIATDQGGGSTKLGHVASSTAGADGTTAVTLTANAAATKAAATTTTQIVSPATGDTGEHTVSAGGGGTGAATTVTMPSGTTIPTAGQYLQIYTKPTTSGQLTHLATVKVASTAGSPVVVTTTTAAGETLTTGQKTAFNAAVADASGVGSKAITFLDTGTTAPSTSVSTGSVQVSHASGVLPSTAGVLQPGDKVVSDHASSNPDIVLSGSSGGAYKISTLHTGTNPTNVGDNVHVLKYKEAGTITAVPTLTTCTLVPAGGVSAGPYGSDRKLILYTGAVSAEEHIATITTSGTTNDGLITFTGMTADELTKALAAHSAVDLKYALTAPVEDAKKLQKTSGASPAGSSTLPLSNDPNNKPAAVPRGTSVFKGPVQNAKKLGTTAGYDPVTGVLTLTKPTNEHTDANTPVQLVYPTEVGEFTYASTGEFTLTPDSGVITTAAVGNYLTIFVQVSGGSTMSCQNDMTVTQTSGGGVITANLVEPLSDLCKATLLNTGSQYSLYYGILDRVAAPTSTPLSGSLIAGDTKVSATQTPPAVIATGSHIYVNGKLAGTVIGSDATGHQLGAATKTTSPSGATVSVTPPIESNAATGVSGGGANPTVITTANSNAVAGDTVAVTTTDPSGAVVHHGDVKAASVTASAITSTLADTLPTANVAAAAAVITAGGTATAHLQGRDGTAATCPLSLAPKSYVTTTCTEDTQAHNCANGRDYCCTASTANVLNTQNEATCQSSSYQSTDYGYCGSSTTGYAAGLGPAATTKEYDYCPNNRQSTQSGKQQPSSSANCNTATVPTAATVTAATPTDVLNSGCCGTRGGDSLKGLLNPTGAVAGTSTTSTTKAGQYYATLFGTGLSGAKAACQATCNAYSPTNGGWDCNGFDVRIGTSSTYDDAVLTAADGSTGTWLTAWENAGVGVHGAFVCTLYDECKTSTFLANGATTCAATALPKAYVGGSCTVDTAWFECPFGRPYCCATGTDTTTGCQLVTDLTEGVCSYYPPQGV